MIVKINDHFHYYHYYYYNNKRLPWTKQQNLGALRWRGLRCKLPIFIIIVIIIIVVIACNVYN